MSVRYKTKNDLSEDTREEIAGLLNENLADAIHMALQSKQAHWNVKGPSFIALHELFDKLYDEASDWVDLIAERAVALGGVADGTLKGISGKTRLPDYGLDLSSGADHLEALSGSLASFGQSIRKAIDTADEAGDADTADLFTEVSRGADKMLWFLESHLQSGR